jgi:hypothetical protein
MEEVKSPQKKRMQLSLVDSLELGYDSDEECHWGPNPHQMEADLHVLNGDWAGKDVLQDWQNSVASDWPSSWNAQGSMDECFGMVPVLIGTDWYDNFLLQAEGIHDDFKGENHCYGCVSVAEVGGYSNFETKVDDRDADTSVPDSGSNSSEVEGSASDLGEATSEIEDSLSPSSIAAGSDVNAKHGLVQEDYLRQDMLWRPDLYMNLSHKVVPRKADFTKPEFERSSSSSGDTTMMLRNLPNEYTRSMLMSALDNYGFFGMYDFIYVPIDKCTHWNVGYAFVNFLEPEAAERCRTELAGQRLPSEDPRPDKVMQVNRAHVQGLEKNVEYYKRSAVMTSRYESHRPLVIPGGIREEPPTEASEHTA